MCKFNIQVRFNNGILCISGLCILLDENPVGWQLLQILHSVLSVSVVIFFSVQVGGKIKLLVENLFTSLPILRKHYSNKAPNSMVMSLLFLILGLILRIPLWNLYLIGLADQEEQILEKISHQAILRNNTSVYYFINMDWLLVLHFSSVNISFLLSFSYFFTTVIEEFKQRYMSLQMNSQLCDSNISCIV